LPLCSGLRRSAARSHGATRTKATAVVGMILGRKSRSWAARIGPVIGVAAGLALVAVLVGPRSFAAQAPASPPTLAELVGQKLVVAMDGTTPSASLLARAGAGRIGGVIVHRTNFTTAAQLRAITTSLQAAAAAGGQPPLLIGVDQEGGPVKTVWWAPPTISPRQLGRLDSSSKAASQGRETGRALRELGINVDFAPVADVPASTESFMYREGRTWSFSARRTARLATAFAVGLDARGVVATMKHFPGLGFATRDTDDAVVRIGATKAQLAPGLRPYRRAIANHLRLVMLSNAVYTAYDGRHAAGWSRAVGTTLFHRRLGYQGTTITDSLDSAAQAREIPVDLLAVRAARAGTDLILVTGPEAVSRSVHASLMRAARSGQIARSRLVASHERIESLKAGL
jgi:beta-N-acetylhexosaminidase